MVHRNQLGLLANVKVALPTDDFYTIGMGVKGANVIPLGSSHCD